MEDGTSGSDATPQQQEYDESQQGERVVLPPPPSNYSMPSRNRRTMRLIMTVLAVVVFAAVVSAEGYFIGHTRGYDEGSSDGYDTGYSIGYEEGNEDSYDSGYDTGYDEGYDEGHDAGYSDGIDFNTSQQESIYPLYSAYRECHPVAEDSLPNYLTLMSVTINDREGLFVHSDGETKIFTCVADELELSDSLRNSILVDGSEGEETVGDLSVSWNYETEDGLVDLMITQSI